MSTFAKSLIPAAVLALAVASNPAMAAKQVDGGITLNGFQLIDLAPADGVAPSVAWENNYVYGGMQHQNAFGQDDHYYVNPNGEPIFVAGQTTGMAYSGSLLGGPTANIHMGGSLDVVGNFGGIMTAENAFHLSPHTEIVLLGNTHGSIHSNNGGENGENGGTGSWISLTYDFVNGDNAMYFSGIYSGAQPAYNQDFALHLRNDSDDTIDGHLKALLWVSATENGSPVTPVPEPETYAMMLGGLSVLALVARRRRAASK